MASTWAKILQMNLQRHALVLPKLLKPSKAGMLLPPLASSFTTISPSRALPTSQTQIQLSFSTNTKTKKNQKETDTPKLTYQQQKVAKKQRRTELYKQKIERLERLKTRRQNSPKNVLKNQFESWFLKRRDYQEIHEKLCKRANKKWKVNVACIVERLPVVTPDKKDWEIEFEEVQAYLSQFKRTYPADTPFGPPSPSDLPQGFKYPITDDDVLANLPENFTPAPRITEADHINDIHSLDRKLPERMYLITKNADPETMYNHKKNNSSNNKLESNKNKVWMFPISTAKKDETLLQTAVRISKETYGEDLTLFTMGNCPMAVDLFVYNQGEDPSSEYYGEKTFYFRLERDAGNIDEDLISKDEYAWLSRDEIVERVREERGYGVATLHHYLL